MERAGRIAAAYWDDPAKWAVQQGGKFGRGILACARATDPFYPLDKNLHRDRPTPTRPARAVHRQNGGITTPQARLTSVMTRTASPAVAATY